MPFSSSFSAQSLPPSEAVPLVARQLLASKVKLKSGSPEQMLYVASPEVCLSTGHVARSSLSADERLLTKTAQVNTDDDMLPRTDSEALATSALAASTTSSLPPLSPPPSPPSAGTSPHGASWVLGKDTTSQEAAHRAGADKTQYNGASGARFSIPAALASPTISEARLAAVGAASSIHSSSSDGDEHKSGYEHRKRRRAVIGDGASEDENVSGSLSGTALQLAKCCRTAPSPPLSGISDGATSISSRVADALYTPAVRTTSSLELSPTAVDLCDVLEALRTAVKQLEKCAATEKDDMLVAEQASLVTVVRLQRRLFHILSLRLFKSIGEGDLPKTMCARCVMDA
jgi:hypothetical protein